MQVKSGDGKLPMENKIEEKDIVDLNDAEFQTKLMNYALNGVPSKDRQGHRAHINFRTHPFQPDYFEYVRSKVPKKTWKSQAHFYRCVFAVGCLVMTRVFDNIDKMPDIIKYFELLDRLNDLALKSRMMDLEKDTQKAQISLVGANTNGTLDELSEKVSYLCEVFEKSNAKR